MKSTPTFAAALLAAVLMPQVAAQQACATPVEGYCGNAQGSLCCPTSAYCQPWNNEYYQCLAVPAGTSDFETDVDYFGNDIGSISKISPAECAAKCQATAACKFFTFWNLAPEGPTCYMKSAKGASVRKVGAVSGRVLSAPWTPAPTPPSCSNQLGSECKEWGSGRLECCPAGAYCQEMDLVTYRCTTLPEVAGAVAVDTEYDGEEVGKVFNVPITKCAEVCRATKGCNYYSFVNLSVLKSNNLETEWSLCYLRSTRTDDGIHKKSVYSGGINPSLPAPTPAPYSAIDPTPAPAPTPFPTPAPSACSTPVGEYCGNGNGVSACCPTSSYCMPWDKFYYQCQPNPDGCGAFETDVDYYGNDVGSFINIQPWECCTKCKENAACKFFSFVNSDPKDPPTCYLKSSNAGRVHKVGAVSGARLAVMPVPTAAPTPVPTPAPTPEPTPTPVVESKCGATIKNTVLDGFDMMEVVNPHPNYTFCCDLCAQTPGCKAYTLYTYDDAWVWRCVLKSGVGSKAHVTSSKYAVLSAVVTSPLAA